MNLSMPPPLLLYPPLSSCSTKIGLRLLPTPSKRVSSSLPPPIHQPFSRLAARALRFKLKSGARTYPLSLSRIRNISSKRRIYPFPLERSYRSYKLYGQTHPLSRTLLPVITFPLAPSSKFCEDAYIFHGGIWFLSSSSYL